MRNRGIGKWSIRRRIILCTLVFCAVVVLTALFDKEIDPEVAKTAIGQAFLSASMVIGSYVFGATWDDKNARKDDCDSDEDVGK